MQTGMFIAPLIGAAALLLSALAWPASVRHLQALDTPLVVTAVVLALLVTYLVKRQFRAYQMTPELADAYRAPNVRRATLIWFISIPVLVICLTGIALRVATVKGLLP